MMRLVKKISGKKGPGVRRKKPGPTVPMDLESQVSRLKKKVGDNGVQEAINLSQDYSRDVLSLAFRMRTLEEDR